jgi:hypothetical protein
MSDSTKGFIDGLSLSLAFLISSIVLYFVPDFIWHPLITRSLGVLMGIIGILGFLVELNKTPIKNPEVKEALREVGAGLFIGVIIIFLLYFFTNGLIHLIITFLMVLSIYGTLKGVFKLVVATEFSKANVFQKIPLIVLNIAIFTLTIMQLLQIFKIVGK